MGPVISTPSKMDQVTLALIAPAIARMLVGEFGAGRKDNAQNNQHVIC